MSWAFGATGSKDQCLAQLESSTGPDDAANAQQYKLMQSILKAELEQYGDDSTKMNIAASGHAPDCGDRSFSIWISGNATPRAEKPAPRATPAPAPAPASEAPTGKRK